MTPTPQTLARKRSAWLRAVGLVLTIALLIGNLLAQAGRRAHPTSEASTVVNVVAVRTDGAAAPITSKEISLFKEP